MTNPNETLYRQMYSNNLSLTDQQMGSRLKASLTHHTASGEIFTVSDQIGKSSTSKNVTAGSDTIYSKTPKIRRIVSPDTFEVAELLSWDDLKKMVQDPTSTIIESQVAALGRDTDIQIINAFFATAYGGKSGGDTFAFDTNNVIAVDKGASAATGLNVAKLKSAKKTIKENEAWMPGDKIYCVITAQQEEDLLNDIQVINNDYSAAGVQIDSEGNLMKYLGINFLHTELLQTDSSSYRRIPFYTNRAMHFAEWKPITGEITQKMPDKRYEAQMFACCMNGATRTREGGVVEIKCAE